MLSMLNGVIEQVDADSPKTLTPGGHKHRILEPIEVCTLHPTPYTLHPTPYTLHPTPYTLHPTTYTLHPTPWAVSERRGNNSRRFQDVNLEDKARTWPGLSYLCRDCSTAAGS